MHLHVLSKSPQMAKLNCHWESFAGSRIRRHQDKQFLILYVSFKKSLQVWLQNLQDSVQTENVGPSVKIIKHLKTVAEGPVWLHRLPGHEAFTLLINLIFNVQYKKWSSLIIQNYTTGVLSRDKYPV